MNIKIRNMKKKLMSFALIACMAGSISFMGASDVNAAGTNPTNAETVQFGKDNYGSFNLGYQGGSHYYKFKTSQTSGINYTVRGTYTDAGDESCIDFYLLDSNYKELDEYGKTDGWSSSFWIWQIGDAKSITYKNLKPGQTYYIKVKHSSRVYEGADRYAVCVKKSVVKPGKPVVKSCKAGKGKVTLSYYKTKYAKRYQVQIKKKGGSWKTCTNGTSLSKTYKSLKKGKKYTLRVRAQRYVDGKWYSGSWSNSRTVTIK